jgi:hypothetical protein
MSYIDGEDMIFNNDVDNNIHTGGFSVNSILMKGGFSPIITLNNENTQTGGYKNVSDIFNSLVVPNWALSYHNKMSGGAYEDKDSDEEYSDEEDSDDEDLYGGKKVVSENIHDKLIKLVSEHESKVRQTNKKQTKRQLKQKRSKTKKNRNKKETK